MALHVRYDRDAERHLQDGDDHGHAVGQAALTSGGKTS